MYVVMHCGRERITTVKECPFEIYTKPISCLHCPQVQFIAHPIDDPWKTGERMPVGSAKRLSFLISTEEAMQPFKCFCWLTWNDPDFNELLAFVDYFLLVLKVIFWKLPVIHMFVWVRGVKGRNEQVINEMGRSSWLWFASPILKKRAGCAAAQVPEKR